MTATTERISRLVHEAAETHNRVFRSLMAPTMTG
jgi:hypothetical protein